MRRYCESRQKARMAEAECLVLHILITKNTVKINLSKGPSGNTSSSFCFPNRETAPDSPSPPLIASSKTSGFARTPSRVKPQVKK